MSRSPLVRLFNPRSVAVVGASTTAGKAGNALLRSLKGFRGDVVPVHPRGGTIGGRQAYGSVRDIPSSVDLALLAVPAEAVAGVIAECGEAGIGGVVVHAGGFGETGESGAALESEVRAAARASGMRVLGPNTSGFIRPSTGMVATFVTSARTLEPGRLAIVAQSGGVNHALAFAAAQDGMGIHLAVGLGNALDVDAADVLHLLAEDDDVGAVALALEGIPAGRAVIDAIERLSDRVPVVALKVGRTDVGAFAQSHTGAMTGDWSIARAALRQAGAVLVDDSEQLVDAVRALGHRRLPAKAAPGVGVVTAQAGPGLLLTDALGFAGVPVPELSGSHAASVAALVGPMTYHRNPVDTGRPGPGFSAVLEAVAGDPAIDVLAIYVLDEPDAIDLREVLATTASGPAVVGTAGPAAAVLRTRDALREHGVPVYPTPERLARSTAALVEDARARHRRVVAAAIPAPLRAAWPVHVGAGPWDEDGAKRIIEELGVRVPRRRVVQAPAELEAAADAVGGFPVVLKLVHPTLVHKSDSGAVRVGLQDSRELEGAGNELLALGLVEGARLLVEELAPPGPELLVGAVRDPSFGPILVLGAGGVTAEAAPDVSIRLLPAPVTELASMLGELRCAPLYRGFRGMPAIDEAELTSVLTAVGGLLVSAPTLSEVEINPLRVIDGGLLALDALITA